MKKLWKSDAFDFVRDIQIELSTYCDGNCFTCPQSTLKRAKQMDDSVFKKILYEVANDSLINKIIPYGFGETFLTYEILEKLRYIRNKTPDLMIEVSTNCNSLTPILSETIIKEKLIDKITFSIDGNSQKTYSLIKPNFKFEEIKNNVLTFLELHKKYCSNIFTRAYMTIIEENEHEIREVRDFWEPKLNAFTAFPADKRCKELKNKSEGLIYRPSEYPCLYPLFGKMIIDSDGNYKLCDQHWQDGNVYGNVKEMTLRELYTQEKIEKIRYAHIHGFKSQIDRCKNCSIFYHDGGFGKPRFTKHYGW